LESVGVMVHDQSILEEKAPPTSQSVSVRIEPVQPSHARAIQTLAEDPLIAATTNLPEPYPPDGARNWIRYLLSKRKVGVEYAFAIINESGELVGVNGLVDVSLDKREAELGYWIGRSFWGRGYATEGTRLLVEFGFEVLSLRSLFARSLVRNDASRRVLEKLGFSWTGNETNVFPKFEPKDRLAVYELTLGQWLAAR